MPSDKIKTYRVTYTDEDDVCCPHFTMTIRGYDREHVEMKFFDSDDDTGWRIVSIVEVRK